MVKVPAASRERHAPKGQKTETGDKTVGYPRPVWRRRRRSGTIFGRSMTPGRRPGPAKGPLMDWARILAYVTGALDQELLARNEYLATENRILKAQLKGRLKLSDAERVTLGEIGHRLGRKLLAEVATVAKPDTILAGTTSLSPANLMARRGVEVWADLGSSASSSS